MGWMVAAVGAFKAGQTGGGGLKIAFGRTPDPYFSPADSGVADYRQIYWRLFLRHPAGWNGAGADKLSRLTIMAANCLSDSLGLSREESAFS